MKKYEVLVTRTEVAWVEVEATDEVDAGWKAVEKSYEACLDWNEIDISPSDAHEVTCPFE